MLRINFSRTLMKVIPKETLDNVVFKCYLVVSISLKIIVRRSIYFRSSYLWCFFLHIKIVRKSADRWRYNLIGYKISWIFNKVWPRVVVFTWTDRDHNAPIFLTKCAYRNVVPCIAKTSQKHRTGGAKHQNKSITWKFNLSPTQWC